MNKEDYFKYYIQGSDHYLIPRDIFEELFDEMSNWRKESKELNQKYLNAVADYETTMFEKEQLNSLVNSCQEEIRRLKKQLEVGDYVNGHKVYDDFRLDTDDYGIDFIEIGVESDKFLNHYIREDEIKSIVTKEQFESMSYKAGD